MKESKRFTAQPNRTACFVTHSLRPSPPKADARLPSAVLWLLVTGHCRRPRGAALRGHLSFCATLDATPLVFLGSTKPSRRLTLLLVHLFCSLVFGLPQSGVISLGRFTWITASRRKVRALRTAPVFSRSSLAWSVSLAACFPRSRRTKDQWKLVVSESR